MKCNWTRHEGDCTARVDRAEWAAHLCGLAYDTVSGLERQQRAQAGVCDLFTTPVDQAEIDFWWSVHKATGAEYRRMARLFILRCRHGKAA